MDGETDNGHVFTNCVIIGKVSDPFGALSNMAGGYPLQVNGVLVRSAEALYQTCRFPHRPDWQQAILAQHSPMAAKMQAKKERRRSRHSRTDWAQVCLTIRQWVVRVKLAYHYERFATLLRASADRPIVERAHRDTFWGAVLHDGHFQGWNTLGQVLMTVRHEVAKRPRATLLVVLPPAVPHCLLLGSPISAVTLEKSIG